jgi:hypothetical protein
MLLEKYPQKWENIREGFRPVAKMMRPLPLDLKEGESA